MNLNEFILELISRLSEKLGDSFNIVSEKILKNNSVELDAIIIRHKDRKVSPSIYINRYYTEYMNGTELNDIVGEMLRIYESSSEEMGDNICNILDTVNAEERVILKLVNYEKNRRILENAVYDRVNDLAVTYHYLLPCETPGIATVRLTDKLCEYFRIEPETIRKKALSNTMRFFPAVFERLDNMLKKMLTGHPDFPEGLNPEEIPFLPREAFPVYVLSNEEKCNGASCLLYSGILDRIQLALGNDFYIIPSSINEVLILPDGDVPDASYLEDMVRCVNRDHVADIEILSDRVYHYPEDRFELDFMSSTLSQTETEAP